MICAFQSENWHVLHIPRARTGRNPENNRYSDPMKKESHTCTNQAVLGLATSDFPQILQVLDYEVHSSCHHGKAMSLLVDDCQTAENEKVEAFLLYRREFYSHICTNTQVTEPTDAIGGNIKTQLRLWWQCEAPCWKPWDFDDSLALRLSFSLWKVAQMAAAKKPSSSIVQTGHVYIYTNGYMFYMCSSGCMF